MQLTSRSKFLFLMGVFMVPVVAAYLAYFGWRPAGHANYGALLKVAPLQHTAGKRLDGKSFNLDALHGKWVMVHIGAASCDAACTQQLYLMRQVRITQGKEQSRIERAWIVTDNGIPDAALLQAHPVCWCGGRRMKPLLPNFPLCRVVATTFIWSIRSAT